MIFINTNVDVKNAGVEQLPALTELFNQYRMFYGQGDNLPACNHFLFERLINHESVIYLAYLNKKPVGFAQLYPSFSSVSLLPIWILNDLYVAPEARKRGVAKAILNRCQQLVQERQDKGLVLETAPDNLPAKALYEQLGFKQDAAYDHYVWQR